MRKAPVYQGLVDYRVESSKKSTPPSPAFQGAGLYRLHTTGGACSWKNVCSWLPAGSVPGNFGWRARHVHKIGNEDGGRPTFRPVPRRPRSPTSHKMPAPWWRISWKDLASISTPVPRTENPPALSGAGDSFPLSGSVSRQPQEEICLKKSFPLSSTRMKAGKSSTSIFQMASIPSSGYSTTSTFLMFSSARRAAAPPMDPR